MNECELVLFITSIACGLAKCCSTEELKLLAGLFTQLGDTIATILTQRELSEKNEESACR